jgi:hypothetical protein
LSGDRNQLGKDAVLGNVLLPVPPDWMPYGLRRNVHQPTALDELSMTA